MRVHVFVVIWVHFVSHLSRFFICGFATGPTHKRASIVTCLQKFCPRTNVQKYIFAFSDEKKTYLTFMLAPT